MCICQDNEGFPTFCPYLQHHLIQDACISNKGKSVNRKLVLLQTLKSVAQRTHSVVTIVPTSVRDHHFNVTSQRQLSAF